MADIYNEILNTFKLQDHTEATTQAIKLDNLQSKKEEKLQRLGGESPYEPLSNSHTVMEDGTLESNSNKIWNEYTPIERQFLLGYATANYGSDVQDSGESRLQYLYPTKDGGSKLGLSTGGAETSDVRYDNTIDPRYDDAWRRSGETGPDIANKVMDVRLAFPAATVLEGIEHGNAGNLADRKYKYILSPEALLHDGGVSEYYNKKASDYYGDASKETLTPERQNELKADFDRYVRLPQAQSKDTKGFAEAPESITYKDYMQFEKEKRDSNFLDSLEADGNRIAAIAAQYGLAPALKLFGNEDKAKEVEEKAAYDLENADYLAGYNPEDMGTLTKLQRATRSGATALGNKLVSGIGYGVETVGSALEGLAELDKDFVAKENKRLSKIGEAVSETRTAISDDVTEAGTWLQEVGKGIQDSTVEFVKENKANKITGYNSRDIEELSKEVDETIKNEGYISAATKALTDVRSFQVLAQSLPEMAALAVSVGGMALVNVNHNLNIAEENANRELTTTEKVKSASVSIVSTYLDRVGDKLALSGMNGPKMALKAVVDKAPPLIKNELVKNFGKGILSIGEVPLRLLGAGLAEGVTEKYQTLGETAAQNVEVFNKGYTQEQTDESNVAGVLGFAAGPQMTVGAGVANVAFGGEPKADSKDELSAKIEEIRAAEETIKTNIESKVMAEPAELTEVDEGISTALGIDSVNKVLNESEDVDTALSKINEAKSKILEDVYDYDAESNVIVGVKDSTKLDSAETWLEQYSKAQADADGNIPKDIETEIAYFKQVNDEYRQEAAKEVETAVETSLANKVKATVGIVDGMAEEDVVQSVDAQIESAIKQYKLDESMENVEEFKGRIKQRVLSNYGISGMTGLGNNISVEMDKEAFAAQARQNAGVKTNLESRGAKRGGTVVEVGSVTNEDLQAVLNGEGVTVASDKENTKFAQRVVDKLDPLSARSVVDTLSHVNTQMDVAIAKNKEEAGKYLKGGDVLGNMKRLMAVAINTINGQVVSDTELRASIADGDSMLRSNEYWASKNNVMEQIGKDYATSYGLKLTGDSKALAKVYRELGRFAIQMLEDADLVESTTDTMWSVAGKTIGSDGKPIGPTNAPGVGMKLAKDELTSGDRVLVKDRGIRLKDTKARENALVENGGIQKYESTVGDALKRVVKLMLPNADRAPSTEYVEKPVKVADGITVSNKTESVIKYAGKKPLVMKSSGNLLGILRELKKLNSHPGGLHSAIKNNDSLKRFLLLNDSGSQLLAVSDSGSVQAKLDNLIGLLDNLDELENEDGVYFNFQVDINDRLTLEEMIANYQGDKVYARPLLGVGMYTIPGKDTGARELLIESILDELVGPNDKGMDTLDVLIKYSKVLDMIEEASDGNTLDLMQIVANSPALKHLGTKGGIRILSALQAARDVVESGGGDINTEYIPEKDASASGVFNTTINLVGRNPELFKERLLELGVTIDGVSKEDTTDAYTILKNIITGLIAKYENADPSIGKPERAKNIEAVGKLSMILNDEKFMRNLAKYPIMTWFYSAEKKSIVENLVLEATSELVLKALNGDEKVLTYLSNVTGTEMTVDSVKKMKKGSKEHKAIREELSKVGEAFYDNLKEAFPEVEQNKKEMTEYFEFLTKNSTVDGTDYWKGKIRTAISVLNGADEKSGKYETTSLYKWKNKAMSMTSAEKIDAGLATDDESESLITEMSKEANVTSMMAFFAHLVDSAQAITWLDTNNRLGGKALMSIHDGFRGRPQDLIAAQESVEKATVEIAMKYDFVNEMAVSMKQTAKEMREAAKEATGQAAKELDRKATNLENKAKEIEALNSPRLEAKNKLLKNAETALFGKTGYKSERTVEEEVVEPEVVREKAKDKVYTDILDMLEELPTADERKYEILADKENVKIVSLNEDKIKELLASKEFGDEFKKWVKSGNSFTFRGTVYIGSKTLSGFDEISKGKATAEEILDVVSHEIEHAVIDSYVDKEAKGKAKAEVDAIIRVLDRASKGRIGEVSPRVRQRINYLLGELKKGKELQAVKELIAISREDTVAADVLNELNRMAGLSGNGLSRVIKQLWSKIKEVMENTPLSKLLESTDVYTLGVAVKSIQDKARGVESSEAVAKENNGTITQNTDKTPFDEDFSSYTSKIEPIC